MDRGLLCATGPALVEHGPDFLPDLEISSRSVLFDMHTYFELHVKEVAGAVRFII